MQATPSYAWTAIGGGDHAGANWAPASGSYIAGTHTNIGTFSVAAGATVRVQPWNGSAYGNLTINADNITIGGTLTAQGAGYGGGGGGGGVGTSGPWPQTNPCPTTCKAYSNGPGGAGTQGGANGGVGYKDCANFGTSVSGAGGSGAGPFAGSGAARVSTSNIGRANGNGGGRGGYAVAGGEGDGTVDESLRLGSGGGGGSGGASSYEHDLSSIGGSGGGGAGGSGGGAIKLIAQNNLTISGAVLTNGEGGGNGSSGSDGRNGQPYQCDLQGSGGAGGSAGANGSGSGAGGAWGYFNAGAAAPGACFTDNKARNCNQGDSASRQGGAGGAGGNGAGGGLLLKANALSISGTLVGLGSNNDTNNGGTVKFDYCSISGAIPVGNFGRAFRIPNGVSCFIDIGLRYKAANKIVAIAALPPPMTSAFKVSRPNKLGVMTSYGVALVPVNDAKASGVRIQTPSGVRALRVYP